MFVPYRRCDAVIQDEEQCGVEAVAAFYSQRDWHFLCSSHVNTIESQPPKVRETLTWLSEETTEELLNRAMPGGEDR